MVTKVTIMVTLVTISELSLKAVGIRGVRMDIVDRHAGGGLSFSNFR